MNNQEPMDRRRFAGQLIAGTGLAAAAAGWSVVTGSDAEVPPPPKLPEDRGEAASEPPAEVYLLTYLVRSFPSEHFDDQALQAIFRDIRGDVARGRVLAEFPLKNSDEPAFAFAAYRQADAT
jgi:hypothetical protein